MIPQPHGGALLPPARKGERRFGDGKPTNREKVAVELARRMGLEWVLELARGTKERKAQLVDALLKVAEHGEGQFGTGKVNAQRLIADLLGVAQKAIAEVQVSLEVEVRRKVRDMGDEEAPVEVAVEPREVECEVVEEGLSTGDSVACVDNSGVEIPAPPRLPRRSPPDPPTVPHHPRPTSPPSASPSLVGPPIGGGMGLACGRHEPQRETPLPPVAVEVPEWQRECGLDGEPLELATPAQAVYVAPSVDPQGTNSPREGMSTPEADGPQGGECALPDPEEGRPRPPK